MRSLDEAQRKKSVLGFQMHDLVLGPGRDGQTIQPEGIKGSDLTDQQREMLLDLASEWTGIRTGWGTIQMEFTVINDLLAPGTHQLTLKNRHLPAMSVYLFNAALPPASIHITRQRRNRNQSTGEIEFRLP